MPPVLIVEVHPIPDALRCLDDSIIGFQVDLFIFQAAPEALNKHIVHPAALAIHADLNPMGLEHICEALTGKLATLVGVKDNGCEVDPRSGAWQVSGRRSPVPGPSPPGGS